MSNPEFKGVIDLDVRDSKEDSGPVPRSQSTQ